MVSRSDSNLANLSTVSFPPEVISRGTGEAVDLQEAIVYDFMPRIVGDSFRRLEPLVRNVHFYGGVCVPFLALEEAYRGLAEQELNRGNIPESLEAYKRGLHNRFTFTQGIARIQKNVLLNLYEIQKLDIGSDFRFIEEGLIQALLSQEISFNLSDYVSFLGGVRGLERDAIQLNQLFFFGARNLPHEDPSKKDDPETGRRLRDTYAKMGRFSNAAWISETIGDTDGEKKYRELAKTDPEENPRLEPILEPIRARFDRDW